MGTPYMPWQQYVADVSGEVNPKTGLPIYRDIIVFVPRQQGKTTLVFIKKTHRALGFGGPQETRFTAQTKDDARARWLKEVEMLEASPLKRLFKKRTTNGSEHLRWFNGSIENLKSGTEKAGHGATLDLGVISEAFAQKDNRIATAMRPAMLTRPAAQLLIESTAGTATSLYLNDLVAQNRERLLAEPDAPSRVAYFEWSATEEDDPGDPRTWMKCMPGLGHTIRIEEVQHEWDTHTKVQEFKRNFLNITDTGVGADTQVFDQDDWDDTGVGEDISIVGARAFALDVTNDRSWSSIAWAGQNGDLDDQHELIAHARGTDWVVRFLAEKMRRNDATTVAVVGGSQAALMQDDLERAGLHVLILSRADYAAACAQYYDGIVYHSGHHPRAGQVDLDVAMSGAAWTSRDPRVWARANPTIDISPLVSCTVAAWAYRLQAQDEVDLLSTIA